MKYIQRIPSLRGFLGALLLLGGLGLAAGPTASPARAQAADPRLQDMALGRPDAPVTIVEYASLTCPHCAAFHANVLPALKKEYIDTGKARLIFRDFPLDQLALAAAAVSRCAGPERYFSFIEVFFAQQRTWAGGADPRAAMTQIARLGGMSTEQIDACWASQAVSDYILNSRLEAVQKFNVESTPTLIVNGRKLAGVPDMEEFRKLLDGAAQGGGASAGGLPQASGSWLSAWFPAESRVYIGVGLVVIVVGAVVAYMLRRR